MTWRRFTPQEVRTIMRLYRVSRWSYARIGMHLDRNRSSIGDLIRREDMAEEMRLCAAEDKDEPSLV
jgi:hypothetical protein